VLTVFARTGLSIRLEPTVVASDLEVPVVIFADVDGVLSSSSIDALARATRTLEQLGSRVPLVLCSGRTRPEIEQLSQDLGLAHPFICEHGAAAFIPKSYFPFEIPNATPAGAYHVVEFGRSASSIRDMLRRAAARHGITIRTLSDMSVEDVAQMYGASLLRARLIKLRDYGELFTVDEPGGSARLRLLDALRAMHLRCVPGQPFDHVGAAVDIGIGVGLLRTLYRRAHGTAITVGIADWLAEGDVLQLVECPIVLEGPYGSLLPRFTRRSPQLTVVRFVEDIWAAAVRDRIHEVFPRVPARASANT
jgi:mannosyl-3-phosphoglycerate phosphatase